MQLKTIFFFFLSWRKQEKTVQWKTKQGEWVWWTYWLYRIILKHLKKLSLVVNTILKFDVGSIFSWRASFSKNTANFFFKIINMKTYLRQHSKPQTTFPFLRFLALHCVTMNFINIHNKLQNPCCFRHLHNQMGWKIFIPKKILLWPQLVLANNERSFPTSNQVHTLTHWGRQYPSVNSH